MKADKVWESLIEECSINIKTAPPLLAVSNNGDAVFYECCCF